MTPPNASLLAQIQADVLSSGSLADALRKCVLLGGKVGSTDLREWATRELKGYGTNDDVPEYRTVGAVILCDAIVGNTLVTGQLMSPAQLPEFAQKDIDESFTFRNGIGEIEAMLEEATKNERPLRLALPMAVELAQLMDKASGNPYQHITALYRSIGPFALRGIVDQVKTTLTELVAEMMAGTPDDVDIPSRAIADQAVNVAVHGDKARVTVTTNQATGGSSGSAGSPEQSDSRFWTRSRKIGAFVAGLASLCGLGVAVAQWLHWI